MAVINSIELYKFWKFSNGGHGSNLPNWQIIFAFKLQQMSATVPGLFVLVVLIHR